MKIVGIVSWYDEKPASLAACVASMIRWGCDHILAVDGAYALYPAGRAASSPEQHAIISETCRALGVGSTIHVPDEPYFGNEIEKRTLCFQIAESFTDETDWYWINDADQIVISALGVRERLAETEFDVATVLFHDAGTDPFAGFPVRCLFRALRGLHLYRSHCCYRTADGRYLWAGNRTTDREPQQELALDLFPIVSIEHASASRTVERMNAKASYYQRRAEQVIP